VNLNVEDNPDRNSPWMDGMRKFFFLAPFESLCHSVSLIREKEQSLLPEIPPALHLLLVLLPLPVFLLFYCSLRADKNSAPLALLPSVDGARVSFFSEEALLSAFVHSPKFCFASAVAREWEAPRGSMATHLLPG
jgi:hypothetical protein